MKTNNESPAPETSPQQSRQLGLTERLLIRHGIPVTRENWINLAYMGHPPEEWTYEHEMELPKPPARHESLGVSPEEAEETGQAMTKEEWLREYDRRIAAALESQKTRSPEMARDMQWFLENMEMEMEAKGMPIPKRSHLFAPERLFPKPN